MKIYSACPHCGTINHSTIVGADPHDAPMSGSAIVRCYGPDVASGCKRRYVADWKLEPEVTTIKLEQ